MYSVCFCPPARVVKEHKKRKSCLRPNPTASLEEVELLRLVRRLSNNDHVKMGANVSRHSSKGLSGRRTQSSGSICNGKGARSGAGEQKICGSLPSYLDETDATACNNNHRSSECEKPPLDDVSLLKLLTKATSGVRTCCPYVVCWKLHLIFHSPCFHHHSNFTSAHLFFFINNSYFLIVSL